VNPSGFVPVPLDVVTATVTAPAAFAGTYAVIWVLLTTVKLVAAVPPNVTLVAPVKPEPVMVVLVPPAVLPVDGLRLVMDGSASRLTTPDAYANPLSSEPLVPSGLTTVTLTGPDGCTGVVAVRLVALCTMELAAGVPPKVTVAPAAKFVPEMVTAVPPLVSPVLGVIFAMVGALLSFGSTVGGAPRAAGAVVALAATIGGAPRVEAATVAEGCAGPLTTRATAGGAVLAAGGAVELSVRPDGAVAGVAPATARPPGGASMRTARIAMSTKPRKAPFPWHGPLCDCLSRVAIGPPRNP
jgi:hypothetical protein